MVRYGTRVETAGQACGVLQDLFQVFVSIENGRNGNCGEVMF